MKFNPKTILIYTFGDKIGDCVRSAKLIKAVMDEFPDAEITWGYNEGTGFSNSKLKEAFRDNLL